MLKHVKNPFSLNFDPFCLQEEVGKVVLGSKTSSYAITGKSVIQLIEFFNSKNFRHFHGYLDPDMDPGEPKINADPDPKH
jgi:hypothetical protein